MAFLGTSVNFMRYLIIYVIQLQIIKQACQKDSVIKKETGNNLYQQLQKLAKANKSDSYFAKSFETLELNNLKCKPKNKVNIPNDKNETSETKTIMSKNTNKLQF
ncbi:hypothetical protein PCHDK_000536000 [Plasmodium chabaudi adami]|uniref:CIR protein n=1 Tax=Plasmodium chabaudi adami TaxID=5826 RepID=A0A1D3LA59_PLACE|nr:hypothetical protein PCHDK_000536000 [Plasmodium chabaudi adami]